jgi:hypothetical protein
MKISELDAPSKPKELLLYSAPESKDLCVTESALNQKRDALILSQEVVKVDSPQAMADCVAAQSLLRTLIEGMDTTRTELGKPYWDEYKRINNLAKAYSDTLEVELRRIEKLGNAYTTAQEAARIAENERIMAEQRETQENPNTPDSARERATLAMALNTRPIVEGARTSQDIQFEVTDIDALYRARPDLVKLEVRIRELKATLAIPGQTPPPGVHVIYGVKVKAIL